MAFCLNMVRRALARTRFSRPSSLTQTSLFITALCTSDETNPDTKHPPIKFLTASQMSHEALIRQACSLTANSSSQLLTQVLVALVESGKEYRKAVEELMLLLENGILLATNTNSPLLEEVEDLIVEQRNLVEDQRKAISELVSLMQYVEKTVTAAAETAFLAGAEHSSTLMCERLNSTLEKVDQECSANKKIEDELLRLQANFVLSLVEVSKTTDSSNNVNEQVGSEKTVPADLFNMIEDDVIEDGDL